MLAARPFTFRLVAQATTKLAPRRAQQEAAPLQRILQLNAFHSGGVISDATSGDGAATSANVSLSSPKLDELYTEITGLPEEEVQILGALTIQVLGRKIFPGEFGRGLEGVVPADAADEEEEKPSKTAFAVKLVGFDAKAKIKVIKEVRAIAGLGLKEAKDLVESAPKVIIKDVTTDKAEELKAQLEAVGAQIEID